MCQGVGEGKGEPPFSPLTLEQKLVSIKCCGEEIVASTATKIASLICLHPGNP